MRDRTYCLIALAAAIALLSMLPGILDQMEGADGAAFGNGYRSSGAIAATLYLVLDLCGIAVFAAVFVLFLPRRAHG